MSTSKTNKFNPKKEIDKIVSFIRKYYKDNHLKGAVIGLYMATGLKQLGQKLDDGEFLNVEKIPLKELLLMVEEGSIRDAKTQLCILKAARRLGI